MRNATTATTIAAIQTAKRLSASRSGERPSRPPLAAYPVFRTADLDDAREQVGRIFCPHRLELERGSRLDALQNAARLDEGALLSYLSYGGAVRITPGRLETFYLVQIPLQGSAEITAGRRSIVSTPSLASVLSPDDPVDMRWRAGNPQLIVYFERLALEHRLEALLGRPLTEPLRFALGMQLATPANRSWLGLVGLLREELERDGALLRHPVAASQLVELLATGFLLAHPSNYWGLLHAEQPPVAPRALRRVLDYIDAHLHERLTLAELARVAGVGARSLQHAFRRQLGVTPTAYIRDLRLRRAHADLLSADPTAGDSVTEIALRWGFTHPGRFASLYRAAFGVTPSQTLRG